MRHPPASRLGSGQSWKEHAVEGAGQETVDSPILPQVQILMAPHCSRPATRVRTSE
jgi:hypothetical protein